MDKKYKYSIDCKNCGIESLGEQDFGKERCVKKQCPNCGCMADTKVTNFNKNIKFPYEPKFC